MLRTLMLQDVLLYSFSYHLKLFYFSRSDSLECFTGKVSIGDDIVNIKQDSVVAGIFILKHSVK